VLNSSIDGCIQMKVGKRAARAKRAQKRAGGASGASAEKSERAAQRATPTTTARAGAGERANDQTPTTGRADWADAPFPSRSRN
jgi:hypothetical protein